MKEKFEKVALVSDKELVEEILRGGNYALEFLLAEKCGASFKRLCETYRAARMDVQDLTQEMCVLLAKNDWCVLRGFRARNATTGRSCKLKTYVITCAARLIKKHSEKSLPEIDWSSALSNEEGEWIEVADTKMDDEQIKMSVLEAIMALDSPQERLVLLEYKIRCRPPEEVAQMLKIQTESRGTVENVYTICSRALKNLRILLEAGGVYA